MISRRGDFLTYKVLHWVKKCAVRTGALGGGALRGTPQEMVGTFEQRDC